METEHQKGEPIKVAIIGGLGIGIKESLREAFDEANAQKGIILMDAACQEKQESREANELTIVLDSINPELFPKVMPKMKRTNHERKPSRYGKRS